MLLRKILVNLMKNIRVFIQNNGYYKYKYILTTKIVLGMCRCNFWLNFIIKNPKIKIVNNEVLVLL